MKKMFVTSLLCLMSLDAFSQRPYVIHGTAIEWHVCIVNLLLACLKTDNWSIAAK